MNIDPSPERNSTKFSHDSGQAIDKNIALFYEQIAKHHGLPFQIDDCNEETLATFAATDRGEDLVVCEGKDDMFSKLGI